MTFITTNLTIESGATIGGAMLSSDLQYMANASLSTGLYQFSNSGITFTSTTATTFNVGPVKGWIVNSDDVLNTTPMFINYSGSSGNTSPFFNTDVATYVLVNTAHTLTLINNYPTVTQRRDNIFLGVFAHPSSGVTGVAGGNTPDIIMNEMSQMRAMFTPIRFINEGVIPYPNSTNMTLANTAGRMYGLGIGFITNGNDAPSVININAGAPTTFQYRTQTGTVFTNTTTISGGSYDVSGTRTDIPGSNNQATNQRIYLLANGNIRVQFGQTIYATLTEAITNAQNESFVVFANNRNLAILIGILSVTKGCTNLADTTTAKFLLVSKFGEANGGGAGISTATLQNAYNNSSDPKILTNSVLNGVAIRRGSAADTDFLLIGQNGAGANTFTINGNGQLSATTRIGGGAVANNSPFGFVQGRGSSAGTANDICILGPNITGLTSGFTYVNALNIKQIGVGPSSVDLGLDANGNVVNQISDLSYKENISTIENALDKVKNLRGVKYQWKDRNAGGDDFKLGFIAQEVYQVEPILVSSVGNNLLGVQYKDIPALLVEAIKELASGKISSGITYLETQTILAEDNNIQLNFNGNVLTAVGGGLEVLHGLGEGLSAEIKIDADGNWLTNNDFKPYGIVIPYYTPSSSNDITGNNGNLTRDEDYLYLKTSGGWKRTNLESF